MAAAVTTWSPVIITGVMPALRQIFTASRTSGRGGSIMPTRPMSVRPFSSSSGVGFSGALSSFFVATASTRSACWLMSLTMSSASSGQPPLTQRSSMTSNAPLTMATYSPSILCTVVISLRSESKGISARRGYLRLSAALVMPFFAAAATMAVSVGSPMCFSLPFSISMLPSQQSVAKESRRRTASEQLALISSVRRPSTA